MPYSIISDRCTGCSACNRQCPVKAIHGIFLENYTIHPDICIECGLCGIICPEQAVVDSAGGICKRVPRSHRARPVVDSELCNACECCVWICPSGCRGITGERSFKGISFLKIPGLCATCGECERICIKGAISLSQVIKVSKGGDLAIRHSD